MSSSPLGLCCRCLCQLSWGRAGLPVLLTSVVLASMYSALLATLLSRASQTDEFQARIQGNHSRDTCWQQEALDCTAPEHTAQLSVCFAPVFLYVNTHLLWVLLGAGAQIQESIINLRFRDMFLLEREQQMLIFFWSSSSELSAIRGRFLLAGTTRELSLWIPGERWLCTGGCGSAEPRGCLPADLPAERGDAGMPGECRNAAVLLEFWNATVLRAPLAGLLDTQGISRVLSYPSLHAQVPQPPSLWWKPPLCKSLEHFFTSCGLSGAIWEFSASRADFHHRRLVWDKAHNGTKPRVSILKQNAITHSVGGYLDFHINAENYIWVCTFQAHEMLMVK